MDNTDHTITLTDGLVRRIKAIQAEEANPDLMLRLCVHGGGCAGFQYEFSLTPSLETGDVVFHKHGAKLVVDDMSLPYLDGATVDYAEELIGAGFQVHNPNAQSSCGCGTSFSV